MFDNTTSMDLTLHTMLRTFDRAGEPGKSMKPTFAATALDTLVAPILTSQDKFEIIRTAFLTMIMEITNDFDFFLTLELSDVDDVLRFVEVVKNTHEPFEDTTNRAVLAMA